jgi:hypothetical protein
MSETSTLSRVFACRYRVGYNSPAIRLYFYPSRASKQATTPPVDQPSTQHTAAPFSTHSHRHHQSPLAPDSPNFAAHPHQRHIQECDDIARDRTHPLTISSCFDQDNARLPMPTLHRQMQRRHPRSIRGIQSCLWSTFWRIEEQQLEK